VKISRIETFLVPPRWLFVRVETDTGIVGWGEPVVEGRSETVRTAVEQLSELLIGEDPLRIEDHWQVMTKGSFYRGGPILSFIFSWNNFMFALVLAGANTKTLPVAIFNFVSYASIDWGGLMAAAVVVTIPIMVIALFTQKYIVSGLTAGATKG
jgi:hypothetical protein